MIESLNRNSTGIVWKSQFSTIIMEFGIDPEVFWIGKIDRRRPNESDDAQWKQ